MGAGIASLREPTRLLSDAVLERLRSACGANVYIAGPMTDRPGWNQAAFDHAAAGLQGRGRTVWNPAALFGGDKDRPRVDYMRADLTKLVEAGDVVLLPGWDGSAGARLEVAVARELGLRIWAPDGEPLAVDCRAVVVPMTTGKAASIREPATCADIGLVTSTLPATCDESDVVWSRPTLNAADFPPPATVTVTTLAAAEETRSAPAESSTPDDDAVVKVRTVRDRPMLYVERPGWLRLRKLSIAGGIDEQWLATCDLLLDAEPG